MVDQADLPKVMSLQTELGTIRTANDFFAREGFGLVGVTIGPKEGGGPRVNVSTDYMDYPPQMTETIKSLLAQRTTVISDELRQMGVTMTDPTAPPPVEPEPQQAQARTPRPRPR